MKQNKITHSEITKTRMNKFYVSATDGVVSSVKLRFLIYQEV